MPRQSSKKKLMSLLLVFVILFSTIYVSPNGSASASSLSKVVIIVPGISATSLTDGQNDVWSPHNIGGALDLVKYGYNGIKSFINHDVPLLSCDYSGLPIHPQVKVSDEDNGYMDNNLIKDYYGELGNSLKAQGYSVYYFGYDWRLDNSFTAKALDTFINEKMRIHGVNKISIVAHSMGGLVTAKYIANGNAKKIDKLVTIATPYLGAPKALYIFETGNFLGGASDILMASQLKKLVPNLKTVYQLLPSPQYFSVNNTYYIKKYIDKPGWGTGDTVTKIETYAESKKLMQSRDWMNAGHLGIAESFHNSLNLYNSLWSVDSYFIIGDKESTIGSVKMQYDKYGNFQKATDLGIINGDGTVPIVSAQAGTATNINRRYYVNGQHSNLPKKSNVIQQVKNILSGNTNTLASGIHTTPQTTKKLKLKVECPVNLNVYDSNRNHLGLTPEGILEQDIESGSFYTLGDTKIAFLDEGNYNVELNGTDTGTMTYTVNEYNEDDSVAKSVVFKDVNITSTTKITTDTDNINSITLSIDENGDGTVDETLSPTEVIDNPTDDQEGEDDDGDGDNGDPDTTPSAISIDINGVQGDDGWYKSDTVATVSTKDSESGIDKIEYELNGYGRQIYEQPINISEECINSFQAEAFNSDGSSTTAFRDIKIDKTSPVIAYNASGVEGDDGWFKSNVTVEVNSYDNLSGVRKIEYSTDGSPEELYSQPVNLTQEAIHNIISKGTDIAGNVSDYFPREIKIDKTAPTISYTPSGVVGKNGWFKSDVELTVNSEDNLSGVRKVECSINESPYELYSDPLLLTKEGINNILSKGTDIAGNVSDQIPKEVKIDKTFPIVNIDTPSNPKCGDAYTLSYSVFDAISGVASTYATINGQPIQKGDIVNLPLGDTEIKVVCEDVAGNVTEKVEIINLPLNLVKVSGGETHSAAINIDGSLWTWGNNDRGQLGDGSKDNKYKPIVIKGLPKVTKVSAGGSHTLALDKEGNIWAWGNNEFGQLGVGDGGSTKYRTYPIKISSIDNVVDISAGKNYSLALKSDGTVWAWGRNNHGQLGIGNNDDKNIPIQVTKKEGSYLTDIKSISAGDEHSGAITNDGHIYLWGYNYYGQLGNGSLGYSTSTYTAIYNKDPLYPHLNVPFATSVNIEDIEKIECGYNHTLVINKNGEVYGCGQGIAKEAVSITRNNPIGTYISAYSAKSDSPTLIRISNRQGNYTLGADDTSPILIRSDVTSEIDKVLDVGAGFDTFSPYYNEIGLCNALTFDGKVYAYEIHVSSSYANRVLNGSHYHSGSFRGYFLPVKTGADDKSPVLSNIVAIDSGIYHTIAIDSQGRLYSWGLNSKGQLGLGSEYNSTNPYRFAQEIIFGTDRCPSVPKNISAMPQSSNISLSWPRAEGAHEYEIEVDGNVLNLNENNFYIHENLQPNTYHTYRIRATNYGGTSEWSEPVTVLTREYRPEDTLFVSISCGENHTIALSNDGTVWSWGINKNGQLGDGTTTNRNSLVQVRGIKNIKYIYAGLYHNLAVDANGDVWAWGSNSNKQLGNPSVTTSFIPYPVKVEGIDNVVSVAAGGYHSLAVKSDGTVWAWGYNNMGQLGDGTRETRPVPVQVILSVGNPLNNMSSVSAGIYHSVALSRDKNIYTWGHDYYGQLGDGSIGRSSNSIGYTIDKEDIYAMGNTWSFSRLYPKCVVNTGDISMIAAKYYHTVYIKNDGSIYGFGRNISNRAAYSLIFYPHSTSMDSQLYDGVRPFKFDIFTGTRNNYVQQGYYGEVYSSRTGSFDPAIDAAPGNDFKNSNQLLTALKTDGTVWNYISNLGGSSVNDVSTDQYYTQIFDITGAPLANVKAISRGNGFVAALKNDGSVWTWGVNTNGELGNGTNISKNNAVETTFDISDKFLVPINIIASQSDLSKIDLVWSATEGAEAYDIEINGVVSASTIDSNYIHTDITPNTQYSYRIRAKNNKGESEWSIPVPLYSLSKLSQATNAVVKAENTKVQVAVDGARIFVNGLPDGTDKTNLSYRLDVVQAIIDATIAVENSEEVKTQASVNSARILVNVLPAGTDKTSLTNRVNVIQAIIDAVTGVVNAETVKTQTSVDRARTLVNALPSGIDKTNLTNRLNAVQLVIDATTAVVSAETINLQTNVDRARTLVNVLPTGIDKTNLTNRLNEVQAIIDLTHNDGIAQISNAFGVSLVLKTNGTVWAIGNNSNGQLGNGTTQDNIIWEKTLSGVSQISAGDRCSFALKTDGTLWGAGYGRGMGLDYGNNINKWIHVLRGVSQISSSRSSSFALKTDGTLWASGDSETQTGASTWVQVLTGVSQVSSKNSHTLALKTDGTLWEAGYSSTKAWTQIFDNVSQFSAGAGFTLVLKTDGTLWVIGNNENGQLGDGTTNRVTTFKQVLAGVSKISAGYYHSLALKSDGTVWAAGNNEYGQMGDGTTNTVYTWKQILTDAIKIEAADQCSWVVKTDGTLWATGRNYRGQLGDGTSIDYKTWKQVFFNLTLAPTANNIVVTNNKAGIDDTVVVSNVVEGDLVNVYSASTEGTLLGSATVQAGQTSVTIVVPQIGSGVGNVYVSIKKNGNLESTKTAKSYTSETSESPMASAVKVINNYMSSDDIVTVTGLVAGDVIIIYSAYTGGALLGSATVEAGQTSVTLTIPQLGSTAGNIYVSVIKQNKLESNRTTIPYTAEPTTTAPVAASIVVTNNKAGMDDTVVVSNVVGGDLINVYSASTGGTLLGSATVEAGQKSVSVAIPQIGASAGSIYVSLKNKDKLESTRTNQSYTSETSEAPTELAITIINNYISADDIVTISGLISEDVINIYNASSGGSLIGTGTVPEGQTSKSVRIPQLGSTAGTIYVTVLTKIN